MSDPTKEWQGYIAREIGAARLGVAQDVAPIVDALVERLADLEATVAGLKSELALQRQTLKSAVNLAGGVKPASIKATLPRISRPGVVG